MLGEKNLYILFVSYIISLFWPLIPAPVSGALMSCPTLTRSLYRGLSDSATLGQVSELQRFLKSDPAVYPEGLVTGYFGYLTEKAVQRFQTANNIISYGTPATTGFGVVGPKTRSTVSAKCSDGGFSQIPTSTPILAPLVSALSVSYPNGGEILIKNETATIIWQAPGTASTVDIFAREWNVFPCTGDALCGTVNALTPSYLIASKVPNNGRYVWSIGKDFTGKEILSAKYGIIIRSSTDVLVADVSDSFFTVVSSDVKPSIEIVIPESENVSWKKGAVEGILWKPSLLITNVDIILENGGQKYHIAKSYPNVGAFPWIAGKDFDGADVSAGNYFVRVEDPKSKISDVSRSQIILIQ